MNFDYRDWQEIVNDLHKETIQFRVPEPHLSHEVQFWAQPRDSDSSFLQQAERSGGNVVGGDSYHLSEMFLW